jgi:hypothetical protein
LIGTAWDFIFQPPRALCSITSTSQNAA